MMRFFRILKCFRIHQLLEYSDSLAFTKKNIRIPKHLHRTTTPGTFMIKWKSCLLPRHENQNAARKKPRGRLRQCEVSFALDIVAHHVVAPGVCPGLIQNHPDFRSCHRHFRLSVEDSTSTLFALPFWLLRNTALPITN